MVSVLTVSMSQMLLYVKGVIRLFLATQKAAVFSEKALINPLFTTCPASHDKTKLVSF